MDISTGQLLRIGHNATETDDEIGDHSITYDNVTSHRELEPLKLQGDSAALARDFLYTRWAKYFNSLSQEAKEYYQPPAPYELPRSRNKAGFLKQFKYNLHRNFISKLYLMFCPYITMLVK